MAYAITNDNLQSNIPGLLIPNIGSTAVNQVVGTATATSTSIASSRWEFGDYTSTQAWIPATTQVREGGIGDFQYAHLAYRALVHMKSVSGFGTATSSFGLTGAIVTLECATSTAGFIGTGSTAAPTNQTIIDSKTVPQTATTSTGQTVSLYLFGQVPLIGGAQFARVGIYTPVNGASVGISSTAVDVVIEGVS